MGTSWTEIKYSQPSLRSPRSGRSDRVARRPRFGALAATLDERLLRPLQAEWPADNAAFDPDRRAGRNDYTEVCFAVNALHPGGSRSNLDDGGFTDWTARLSADAKERLLISGLGSERLLSLASQAR